MTTYYIRLSDKSKIELVGKGDNVLVSKKLQINSKIGLKELSDLFTHRTLGVIAEEKEGIFTEGACEFYCDDNEWTYEPLLSEVSGEYSYPDRWSDTPLDKIAARLAHSLQYLSDEMESGVNFEAK
jgi:hypothetical protein